MSPDYGGVALARLIAGGLVENSCERQTVLTFEVRYLRSDAEPLVLRGCDGSSRCELPFPFAFAT